MHGLIEATALFIALVLLIGGGGALRDFLKK